MMLAIRPFALLIFLTAGAPKWAGAQDLPSGSTRTCMPVDLRSEKVAPLRSQLFLHDGTLKDSRYCYAEVLANLVGQNLGVAVSSEEVGLRYAEDWAKSTNIYTLSNGWGGEMVKVYDVMKERGYCRRERFEKYLSSIKGAGASWYTALHREEQRNGKKKLLLDTRIACGPRVRLASTESFRYVQLESFDGRDPEVRAQDFVSIIDAVLDAGKFTALAYDGHYVTIVGRTRECAYLIQDSIPASYRTVNGFRNPYQGTAAEHLQLWSRDSLLHTFHWTTGSSGALPGIGYIFKSN